MAMTWTDQSGYLTNNQLNKQFQKVAQPLMRFRQFVKIKEAFGKHKGETVNWLKVSNISTIGGKLVETETMPIAAASFSWGTLTVNEYGNAIAWTRKMEDLSEFDILDIFRENLLDDFVKVMDGAVEREFNKTPLRYVGTATDGGVLTTDGTATATNNSPLNAYHVRQIVDELRKRNVPPFEDGSYVCIASVEAMSNLRSSLESVFQYTETGYKRLLNGEVGKYAGVRFVEDTFATRYTYDADNRTTTAKSWTNGKSLEAYFFGRPTVREAVAVPEMIIKDNPKDFGRSRALAWYFVGGWAIEWDDEPNARIIKWDSAA